MAMIFLMRLFYFIYFMGIALIFYRALSHLVFGSWKWKNVGGAILFSLVWPLALFSKRGREKLISYINLGE